MAALDRKDIDIANRGADSFLRLYYSAYDSPQRGTTLPKFYRTKSIVSWNGTAMEGEAAVSELIARMPQSKHEVQSYDCHAIPGSGFASRPPSLLITVSGIVTHGPQTSANGSGGAGGSSQPPTGLTPPKTVDAAPRVFSQTFILVPDDTPGRAAAPTGEPTYYIGSDTMRFVG
ncbi:hypothetical protein BOTBODRAFT_31560 [Botryobasidium botryosum FD-172 SS1]|uniref:NTF2 domain-containing protein n=1 Tax=Botryobasidium botryosum (strain FD-172 SS1) TaxID=930990 RepID=A0A067MLR8_BOTB1|nr:hypothetical protein BOTBODRAFT_31560 [Botryobasidium botryosum FD-172 SS1]